MSRLCWMLLCAGVCLGPHILLAQSKADGAPLLHLQDALALADSANRQEEITRIGVAQAKASLSEARSYYFPQLKLATVSGVPLMSYSFTIPAGTLGTYQGIGPLPATDSKIASPQRLSAVIYGTAQQPLTQLYKVHLSVGEAQVGVRVASEQLRQTHQDLVRRVRESYYSISQAQSQLHATETALTYLKELSVEAKNNLAQQTVLQSDAMTVTANLKNAEYSQAQAEDSLALRKQNLNLLLARPLQTPFDVDEDPQPTLQELDLDEAVKEALAQRPELRIAHLQQSQAEFEVRRQKAEYIPDISFGLTYLSFQNIAFFPPNVASVGLTLQWQPIDWGLKKQKLVSLRGSSAQASLKAADVEQQIRLDVDQAFRRLRRSRLQVNAQASALEAEKARWREAKNQYQQKTILLSDLLNEETAVAQAISHYTDGLTEFWSAKAGFAKALGED